MQARLCAFWFLTLRTSPHHCSEPSKPDRLKPEPLERRYLLDRGESRLEWFWAIAYPHEYPSHFHVRTGTAAFWSGFTCGLAARSRARSFVPRSDPAVA